MHLFLWAEDAEQKLRQELESGFPASRPEAAVPGFWKVQLPEASGGKLPLLVFARQWLPEVESVNQPSIRTLAAAVAQGIVERVPEGRPWLLHVAPHYGVRSGHRVGARAWHSAKRQGMRVDVGEAGSDVAPAAPEAGAGRQRCLLIQEAVLAELKRRRRHLLRHLQLEPRAFTPEDSLVQCVLTAPDAALLSVAPAPLPLEQRHVLSPFPLGEIPAAADKSAPSRAFAKLVEAEARFGVRIPPGATCVDLGASPGGWTYVALQRGARVLAVDRSALRADLMEHSRVDFRMGDAFRFEPEAPVDWLLCDVIAEPERTAALLVQWLERRWCRRFVVTLKMKDGPSMDPVPWLKSRLPSLAGELFLTRLSANKKELCAFGTASWS